MVTQEKAKLDAKIKNNDAKIAEGRTEELTEFELKKIEKEKQVIELRERLAKLKEKVNQCSKKVYYFFTNLYSSFPAKQVVFRKTTGNLVPSWERARTQHD